MEDIVFGRPVLFDCDIDVEDHEDTKQIKMAVKRIANDHGIYKYKISGTNVSFGGASNFSNLSTIDIIDLKTGKEINLFFKNIIDLQHSIDKKKFERESFFYNDLALKFDEIQNEFNLPEIEKYRLVKSYKSDTNEMIIMENLLRKGYGSPDRMKIPSLDFVKKSIKELAKFKALSMALNKYRPAYFEQIIKPLDVYIKMDANLIQKITMLLEKDLYLHRNEKVREKLAKRIPNFCKDYFELVSSRNATCGLTHNDYRPSNTLIKVENGAITDYINIDYQFLRYNNIINDFIFFIFISTDRKFRENHLDNIKNYFHDNISKYLNYYNITIDDVYPKEVFEKEYREKLQLGLIGALITLSASLALPDDLPNNKIPMPFEDLVTRKRSPECVRRINDIGEEFLEWGLL